MPLIASRELAKRWCVPESWIGDRTQPIRSRTFDWVALRTLRVDRPQAECVVGSSSHQFRLGSPSARGGGSCSRPAAN